MRFLKERQEEPAYPWKVDSIQKTVFELESNTTSLIDHCSVRPVTIPLRDSDSSLFICSLCIVVGSDMSSSDNVSICVTTINSSGTEMLWSNES